MAYFGAVMATDNRVIDEPGERERLPGEIWVLIASAFVIAVGFGLITPVLPEFATGFGVSTMAASIVISAFAFFRLVGAPGAGRLLPRFGERPVYLAGLLIVAVSSAATAFADSYWQLLLYRSIGGLGSTMFTISAVALLVRLAPPTMRAKVSSAYASAFLLGGIAGPLLGGLLGGLGLRVPFLVYAGFLVVAAAVVAGFIGPEALRPSPEAAELPPMTVREGLRDSAYRAALGSAFANGWANFGVRNAILPLFAAVVISDRQWVAGAALAAFALGNAVGLTFTGGLADRYGRRPFVLAGLVVSGVATAITGWSDERAVLFLLCVVAGLGSGAMYPAQQASIADVVGRERSGGQALSTYQMAQDAGAIIGPPIAGLLVDRGSYGLAFAVTGVITLAAALLWSSARETLPVSR
ncbi:MAG: MFS transporter [Nocardioides sp.]